MQSLLQWIFILNWTLIIHDSPKISKESCNNNDDDHDDSLRIQTFTFYLARMTSANTDYVHIRLIFHSKDWINLEGEWTAPQIRIILAFYIVKFIFLFIFFFIFSDFIWSLKFFSIFQWISNHCPLLQSSNWLFNHWLPLLLWLNSGDDDDSEKSFRRLNLLCWQAKKKT